jgi:hypothetical protein
VGHGAPDAEQADRPDGRRERETDEKTLEKTKHGEAADSESRPQQGSGIFDFRFPIFDFRSGKPLAGTGARLGKLSGFLPVS